MKQKLFAISLLWLTISCCDSIDTEIKCYHGSVIMFSCCSGTSFIELDASTPIGKATTLNGQDFKNVIQVPGYLDEGEIYMNLRAFNQNDDQSLFPFPPCGCPISIEMDVPMWVQTGYSTSVCRTE